jgi:hypothetical protein
MQKLLSSSLRHGQTACALTREPHSQISTLILEPSGLCRLTRMVSRKNRLPFPDRQHLYRDPISSRSFVPHSFAITDWRQRPR